MVQILEKDVKQVVDTWYAKLDVHAPVEELLPLLDDQDLEMHFPEGILRGKAAFIQWYETVTRKFFDETHTMKMLNIVPMQDQASVHLVVNWQAHIWNPPTPRSQWLGFDAEQHWVVKLSSNTQQPVIVRYIVDQLVPMPGSTNL